MSEPLPISDDDVNGLIQAYDAVNDAHPGEWVLNLDQAYPAVIDERGLVVARGEGSERDMRMMQFLVLVKNRLFDILARMEDAEDARDVAEGFLSDMAEDGKAVAVMRQLREENVKLRHWLGIAHLWMEPSPGDCNERRTDREAIRQLLED